MLHEQGKKTSSSALRVGEATWNRVEDYGTITVDGMQREQRGGRGVIGRCIDRETDRKCPCASEEMPKEGGAVKFHENRRVEDQRPCTLKQ